jgi:integrase
MLYSEAISLYRTYLRSRRRATKTLAWYAEQFAAFASWRGKDGDLPDVEEIERFLADCHDAGLSPSTVHARYRALKALFRFLEKRRKIDRDANPILMLEAPSVPKTVRPYVTLPELRQLLATCGDDWIGQRDRLILLLLFFSGLRLSEIAALQVGDLDAAALEVVVRRGKGDKARVVPMSPEVRPALTAYLFQRPEHRDELWLASDGYGGVTGALKPEGIRQMIFRRCKRAGLPKFGPHRFRHGFAMWMLNNGARLTTVATAMGHSDPAITASVYAHTTASTVRSEYDAALATLTR